MDSSNPELVHDLPPHIRVYKDGRVERLKGTEIVAPSFDPKTNVESKDVLYSTEHNLSVRIYLPQNTHQNHKLPLLVYFHGGAFCTESALSPTYHGYLNNLVSEANVIAVSVDYRLAPEHPLPAAYNDSWTTLQWAASHINQNGPVDWLNLHADFQRVFLCGDSAGANISHQMSIKYGQEEKIEGFNIAGIILTHPYFWGEQRICGETSEEMAEIIRKLLELVVPTTTSGLHIPWINPGLDPDLGRVGCSRVLVIVSEVDPLRERGWYYAQKLRESEWSGDLEVVDFKGESHNFQFLKPNCDAAVAMLKRIVLFINQ